jgi:hypothetical protein
MEETLPSGRLKDSRRTLSKTKAGQATNVDHRDGSSGVGAQGRISPMGKREASQATVKTWQRSIGIDGGTDIEASQGKGYSQGTNTQSHFRPEEASKASLCNQEA